MESLKDIIDRQHASRPSHDDPLTDRLLAEILGLAEEVCVLRDRLDTCGHLAGDAVSSSAIDAFELSPEMIEQRLGRHSEYFEALFARIGAASAPQ